MSEPVMENASSGAPLSDTRELMVWPVEIRRTEVAVIEHAALSWRCGMNTPFVELDPRAVRVWAQA